MISATLSQIEAVDMIISGSRIHGGGLINLRQKWNVEEISSTNA
jgi:hypothetical protein